MKFSVIIPTHDPKYLREAVESVLDQTEQDFEIVVVPNGLSAGGAPTIAGLDPADRVRIDLGHQGSRRIGEIKNYAFMQAAGDILVELDHDDLLAPSALHEIGKAFDGSDGKKVDMVYGNFAEFNDEPGITPNNYDPEWHWKQRPVNLMGRALKEVVAFEASPASLGKVYFAPNHPRAWKRDFYRNIGGHDKNLEVCDDQELMVRTYLHGTMRHVDRCLYLYRLHAGNTIKAAQDKILQATWKIYADNIEKLVLRWCDLKGLAAYNVSAGDQRPGWKWCDVRAIESEIEPVNSSVGAFWADGSLQMAADRKLAMRRLHEFLVPGGWLLSQTPSTSGKGAFGNPLAKSYWNDLTFRYFTDKAYGRTIGNDSIRFQPQRLVEYMPSKWHADNNCPYVFFDGIALKEGGYGGPGPVDI